MCGAAVHVILKSKPLRSERWNDLTPVLAEPNPGKSIPFAPARHHDDVAVFEKAAAIAIGQRDWLLTASGDLDERAGLAGTGAGNGAAA